MPILSGISAKAVSHWTYIKNGLVQGLSGNNIIKGMMEQGYSFRRQEMLNDIRAVRSVVENWSLAKDVGLDTGLSPSLFAQSDREMPYRYAATVNVKGYDSETGDPMEKVWTMYSDEPLTKGGYMDQGAELVSVYGSAMDVEDIEILELYQWGGAGRA